MTPAGPTTSPGEEPANPSVAQTTPSSSSSSDDSGPGDLVVKVLGAVGTGIGILGFVTFFGGAILWLRADEANLPANDAVSVIPNSVLVTTGASFLVPAVLIAALAVAAIYAFHLGFYLPRRISQRDEFRDAHTLSLEAEKLDRDAKAVEEAAKAERALAISLTEAAELLQKSLPPDNPVRKQQEETAEKQRKAADAKEAEALTARSNAAAKKADADNKRAAAEAELERTPEQFFVELAVGVVMLAVVPPLLNGAICDAGFPSVLILIGVAAGVAIVSLVTYVATDRFLWFGVVAFVTVGIYIGVATYYSTTKNPKVEPAAALRTGRPPVIGIYIADTASNLYLGSFSGEGSRSRLLVIPRTQVAELTIGPLVNPGVARERAVELALERCRQKVETPKTEAAPASVKGACSKEEKEVLSAALG